MHWLTRATPGPCRPISAIATFSTQYAPRNCSQYGCVEERKVSEYSSGGHALQRYDKSKILAATSFPLRLGCTDWVGICLISDILILDKCLPHGEGTKLQGPYMKVLVTGGAGLV